MLRCWVGHQNFTHLHRIATNAMALGRPCSLGEGMVTGMGCRPGGGGNKGCQQLRGRSNPRPSPPCRGGAADTSGLEGPASPNRGARSACTRYRGGAQPGSLWSSTMNVLKLQIFPVLYSSCAGPPPLRALLYRSSGPLAELHKWKSKMEVAPVDQKNSSLNRGFYKYF